MIDVIKIKIPLATLKAMPFEERNFLLLMGHAENQISILYKLLCFSSNNEPQNYAVRLAASNQTEIILRLLVGTMYEAWTKLFKERFLQRKNIAVPLSRSGQDAVDALNTHFSESGLLGKIRNAFAFHYPNDEDMNRAFKLASEDESISEDWNWYLSTERTNSCYFASEMVYVYAIMREAKAKTLEEAQHKLMIESTKVHGLLVSLCDEIGRAIMGKYISELDGEVVAKIADAPDLHKFVLPFYANDPRSSE